MERSNTYRYAETELDILIKSATDPDNRPVIEPFKNEILSLCDAFGKSGQSGGSAPFTATALAQAIKKLCLQEPICPIMGIYDEWMDVSHMCDGDRTVFQNKRCGSVFKEGALGRPYYLDAIIWKGEDKIGYNGSAILQLTRSREIYRSRQYIKSFPFTPKTFYIDVIDREIAKDDWEHYIKDPRQLNRVFKYYDKYDD